MSLIEILQTVRERVRNATQRLSSPDCLKYWPLSGRLAKLLPLRATDFSQLLPLCNSFVAWINDVTLRPIGVL